MEPSHEKPEALNLCDVRADVARTLIDAMERGETPWQKPWSAQALRPMNPTSGNAYRGVNRLLLALSGRSDPRWMTYQQARENQCQVRRGEKGSTIVKLVEVSAREASADEGRSGVGSAIAEPGASGAEPKRAFALRRYTIFNAEQIEGIPELSADAPLAFNAVDRAEAVLSSLRDQTGLRFVYGGDRAFYTSAKDEVHLPHRRAFHSAYDFYATAMHEGAHATLSPGRLDRRDAIGKRWGDEAYAMEELRAEICSAILSAETGIPLSQTHIDNHAAYLKHWVKVVAADPMAIFSAAKDAELMAQYLLGLVQVKAAMGSHEEWVAEYDQTWEKTR